MVRTNKSSSGRFAQATLLLVAVALCPPSQAQSSNLSVEQKVLLSQLREVATSAGSYAGREDACDSPVGAAVKADFESRCQPLPAERRDQLMSRFRGFYDSMKRKIRPEHCSDEDHRAALKRKYESDMRVLGATSIPGAVAESNTEEIAAILAVAKTLPAVTDSSGAMPDLRSYASRVDALIHNAAGFVAVGEVCEDPGAAAARCDFMALTEPLPAEKRAKIVERFEDRVASAKRYMRSCPYRQRLEDARDGYDRRVKLFADAARAQQAAAAETPPAAPVVGVDGGRIERLTEQDVGVFRGLVVRKPYYFAHHDAKIAGCGGTRDPVLRDNIVLIMKAPLRESNKYEYQINKQIESYDTAYDKMVASIQRTPEICRPDTVDQSYEGFAAGQTSLLEQVESRIQAQAEEAEEAAGGSKAKSDGVKKPTGTDGETDQAGLREPNCENPTIPEYVCCTSPSKWNCEASGFRRPN